MLVNKLKAEKREKKKKRKVSKSSGTLAAQVLKIKVNRSYRGDAKKLK
ncbi:MAG: hypothetical protein WC480_01930 [Patescibacteria group bacterium]